MGPTALLLPGRAIELPGMSWLGPAFSPSAIEDELRQPPGQPSVRQQCFYGLATGARRQVGGTTQHALVAHLLVQGWSWQHCSYKVSSLMPTHIPLSTNAIRYP